MQVAYGADLLDDLLRPQPGETILDLGCGTGRLAKRIHEKGARVIGVDSSATMIAHARLNSPEVEFRIADARSFWFPELFDAVFSSATLHWVLEADRVVASVSAALKPGGRFVAEFGGRGDLQQVVSAAREAAREVTGRDAMTSFFFPSLAEYASILERHRLEPWFLSLTDHPTMLQDGPAGLRSWVTAFKHGLFPGLGDAAIEQALPIMERKLMPRLFRNGSWFADYRRIRVAARKEE
jgi:SAM-dependent methyltransferase